MLEGGGGGGGVRERERESQPARQAETDGQTDRQAGRQTQSQREKVQRKWVLYEVRRERKSKVSIVRTLGAANGRSQFCIL